MKKLKIVLVIIGGIMLVIARSWISTGIKAVATAPVTQTVQDIAAVGALLFVIVGLPLMNFLRGRR